MQLLRKNFVAITVLCILLLAVFTNITVWAVQPSYPPGQGPKMKTLDNVEPRIPIGADTTPGDPNYEYIISNSGSYYLIEDVNTSKSGIKVDGNDVTIDLMGYSLNGLGAAGTNGIYMNGRSNIEIRNGTVRNFGGSGIYENGSGREHRVINIRALSNKYINIRLGGKGHLVKDCVAAETSISVGIFVGMGSTVTGNTAYGNSYIGIHTQSGCTVTGNTAYENGWHGIYAGPVSTVSGNITYSNNSSGIQAESSCTVTGNTASSNVSDGIRIGESCVAKDNICTHNGNGGDGAGILVLQHNNRIEGNNVSYNDRGIDVDCSGNLIIKNSASNNGTPATDNYSLTGTNTVGPIITATGTITSENPWANFSF